MAVTKTLSDEDMAAKAKREEETEEEHRRERARFLPKSSTERDAAMRAVLEDGLAHDELEDGLAHDAGDVGASRDEQLEDYAPRDHTQSGHGFADPEPSSSAEVPQPPLMSLAEIKAAGFDDGEAERVHQRQLAIIGAWRSGARTYDALRTAIDEIDASMRAADGARDVDAPEDDEPAEETPLVTITRGEETKPQQKKKKGHKRR